MSVQRFDSYGYMPSPEGKNMRYDDHACIVAEAGAAVFAFHPEWTVTGMCDPDCLACRRLTELITEREKGYEEGKADAEQEHAAAWDRATFDSTAYEQGKRDAAEEARAAERRHWEARFRNAEQAHAAALAEAVSVIEGLADQQAMYDGWYVEPLERLRAAAAAAPRTLTADDARAAVVRLTEWSAYKHDQGFERAVDEAVIAIDSLIHDGEATP